MTVLPETGFPYVSVSKITRLLASAWLMFPVCVSPLFFVRELAASATKETFDIEPLSPTLVETWNTAVVVADVGCLISFAPSSAVVFIVT